MQIPIARWVAPFGYPRIKACSRLPMAFRSVPRPSSPPGAKASTECPSYTRYPGHSLERPCLIMHGNHPQGIRTVSWKYLCFPQHNTICPGWPPRRMLAQPAGDPSAHIVHRAPEPSPPNHWGPFLRTAIPGQTIWPDNGAVTGPNRPLKTARAQRRTRT